MIRIRGDAQILYLKDGSIVLKAHKLIHLKNFELESKSIFSKLLEGEKNNASFLNNPLYIDLSNEGFIVEYDESKIDPVLEKQFDYLVSQSKSAFEIEQKIKKLKTLVLGCGGTGSLLVQLLIGHGFRNFFLVDGDLVQKNNLNRQLFYQSSSVGRSKVESLKESSLKLNDSVKIQTKNQFISSIEDIQTLLKKYKPNLVICGADTPPVIIQSWILEATKDDDTVLIFGGIGILNCSIGPLLTQKSAKQNYLLSLKKHMKELDISQLAPVRASLSSTNMLGVSLMALELFRYFSGEDTGRVNQKYIFNNKTLQIERSEKY